MQMVVLAGGLGRRLASEIKDVPKPLAPVNGRAFLEYLVESVRDAGQRQFIFCVCHKARMIMDHFGDGRKWGVDIRYSLEKEPLGTAGALGQIRPLVSDTFGVVNGDTYLECNLDAMREWHKARRSLLTLALTEVDFADRYGRVQTDSAGKITRFKEKSETYGEEGKRLVNAGLYLMEPEVLDHVAAGRAASLESDLIPGIWTEGKPVYGFQGVYNFFDIGVPHDYHAFRDWISAENPAGSRHLPGSPSSRPDHSLSYIEDAVAESVDATTHLNNLKPVIGEIVRIMTRALGKGRRIYFCGNGGSAADAQHLAAELAGRFVLERQALPAMALTADISVLTAVANDYGYSEVFARQVQALAAPGDVLVAISTSGNSPNVIRAVEEAKKQGAATIAFTGNGGRLKEIADLSLSIPSGNTAHIQETHMVAGHIVCGLIEERLFGGKR